MAGINTKKRHQEILSTAVRVLEIFGGAETIDALPQDERATQLRKMADNVVGLTNCTRSPARNNVAKAMRRGRLAIMQQQDNWGGARPNPGPDPLPEEQRRQKASPKLAPGSKELALAIAEALELPGWGHAVDMALIRMVYADDELRVKLARMGIIVKANDGKGLGA